MHERLDIKAKVINITSVKLQNESWRKKKIPRERMWFTVLIPCEGRWDKVNKYWLCQGKLKFFQPPLDLPEII